MFVICPFPAHTPLFGSNDKPQISQPDILSPFRIWSLLISLFLPQRNTLYQPDPPPSLCSPHPPYLCSCDVSCLNCHLSNCIYPFFVLHIQPNGWSLVSWDLTCSGLSLPLLFCLPRVSPNWLEPWIAFASPTPCSSPFRKKLVSEGDTEYGCFVKEEKEKKETVMTLCLAPPTPLFLHPSVISALGWTGAP